MYLSPSEKPVGKRTDCVHMVCTDANRLEKKNPTSLPCEGCRTSVLNCEPSTEEAHEWAREDLALNHTLGAHASAMASLCAALDLPHPFFKDALFFPMYPLCFVQRTHPTPGSHTRSTNRAEGSHK